MYNYAVEKEIQSWIQTFTDVIVYILFYFIRIRIYALQNWRRDKYEWL